MKRSKKQNETTPGQLCLFTAVEIRQEEENRMKPKRKPREAPKPPAPALISPAPVETLKQPENSLKTEIPDREEFRRARKANPWALQTLFAHLCAVCFWYPSTSYIVATSYS